MPDAPIEQHCRELNRCNQRGGRMLSVLDLLDAGSLDYELAAFLMAAIGRGASFMAGAQPGGAGKTTVMCALLNLVPAGVPLVAATPETVRRAARENLSGQSCYICHEIGAGPWFAYLRDQDLRDFCALADKNQVRATNLHADNLDEARYQVCEENGVPEAHFQAFELLIFLRVKGGPMQRRHWLELVYASGGDQPHQKVFEHSAGFRAETISEEDAWRLACRDFLEREHRGSRRTIEDVRRAVLDFYAAS
jgi:hypothetical protein